MWYLFPADGFDAAGAVFCTIAGLIGIVTIGQGDTHAAARETFRFSEQAQVAIRDSTNGLSKLGVDNGFRRRCHRALEIGRLEEIENEVAELGPLDGLDLADLFRPRAYPKPQKKERKSQNPLR